jgi:Uma2 family endonuclease
LRGIINRFHTNENVFTLDIIIRLLERVGTDRTINLSPSWVVDVLVQTGVPKDRLFDTYISISKVKDRWKRKERECTLMF